MARRRGQFEFAQALPRRGVLPVDELLLASFVDDAFGLAARAMKVQIVIEAVSIELIDVIGVSLRDVAIAHMLANHRSVFALHQAIVVAGTRARFGLFNQHSLEQRRYRFVDELRAVVGMEAMNGERELMQNRL